MVLLRLFMLRIISPIITLLFISCFKETSNEKLENKKGWILGAQILESSSSNCLKFTVMTKNAQDLSCKSQGLILGVDTINVHTISGGSIKLGVIHQSLSSSDNFKSVYYDSLLVVIDGGKRYIHPQIVQEVESWLDIEGSLSWLEGSMTSEWSSKVVSTTSYLIPMEIPRWGLKTNLANGLELLWGTDVNQDLLKESALKVELLGETFVKMANSKLYLVHRVRDNLVLIGGPDNPKKLINYSKILFDKSKDEK